jgi:uncharacterized Zn-binding protein involved in type VI secretion
MPEAARLTDTAAHGGMVTAPGCPTVLIESLPAARVGDQHVCPAADGPKPHVGGPLVQGAQKVRIGGQFASRKGDQALCAGPPDQLVGGAAKVFIGGATLTFKASKSGGNTLVAVDPETATVYIESFLEYGGPGASAAYAAHAKAEIEATWSGTMLRDGKPYRVEVQVHTRIQSGEPTPGFDPIDVDPAHTRMNQPLYGDGTGHQTPKAADPKRRRIAHEYGHSLGLPDEYHDTPSGSVPDDPTKKNNIMAETWPDASGTLPHPHQDQYDKVLAGYGH